MLLVFSHQVMSHSFCNPVASSSSIHGSPQARILEWVAISFSRGLPDPGIRLVSPALAGGFLFLFLFFFNWATRETQCNREAFEKYNLIMSLFWLKSFNVFCCCKLKVCVPSKPICWILTPKGMIWGDETSRRGLGCEGGALMNEIVDLKKRSLKSLLHSLSCEDNGLLPPCRELSAELNNAGTLISKLQPPEL